MPQRLPSILAWLAVTLVATVIGLVAVGTVGQVLRGSGPLGEEFNAEQTAPAPAMSAPRESTHEHPLATLVGRCDGRTATLVSTWPAPDAVVVDTDAGPDEDVHIDVQAADGTTLRLEIYCNRGEPRLVVEPRT